MQLGDWMPPCPLQGVILTIIADGLYQMRAVGVMGAMQIATGGGVVNAGSVIVHLDPMPDGVSSSISIAPTWDEAINCTPEQAVDFAAHYGGVAYIKKECITIKAVAPGMRKTL